MFSPLLTSLNIHHSELSKNYNSVVITSGIWCVVDNLWRSEYQNVFFLIRYPFKKSFKKIGQGPISVTNSFFDIMFIHILFQNMSKHQFVTELGP